MSKKIAIIEDDSYIQKMYKTKLELSGYIIETANNGEDGLKLIEKFQPDIVLLDLMMPVMSGIETLTRLKKQGGKKYKVIVLSNMGDDDTVEKAKKLGAVDYMIKAELSPTEVEERIRKLI